MNDDINKKNVSNNQVVKSNSNNGSNTTSQSKTKNNNRKRKNNNELKLYYKNNNRNQAKNKKNQKNNKNNKNNKNSRTNYKNDALVNNKTNSKVNEIDINNQTNHKVNEIEANNPTLLSTQEISLVKKKSAKNEEKKIKDAVDKQSWLARTKNSIKKRLGSLFHRKDQKSSKKVKAKANKNINNQVSNPKKLRIKKYWRESLVFTSIFLIIDVLIYLFSDWIVELRLFDIETLNIIVTIFISVVLLFIGSFGFNYLISEFMYELAEKNKQEGGTYRNHWFKSRKHQENIPNKK